MTMTTTTPHAVGVDVGKAHLDVAVADGPVRRFANDALGIAALVDWLQPQAVAQVVYEPTVGYERPLGPGPAGRRLARPPGASQQGAGLRAGLRPVGQDRPPGRSGPGPVRRRI